MDSLGRSKIFFQLSVILIICGAVFVIGYIKGSSQAQLVCRDKASSAIITNQQQAIIKMNNSAQISESVIITLHNQLNIQNESYKNVIGVMQNEKSILVRKLNSTNRINGLLVRNIQFAIDGTTMSPNTIATTGTDGSTTYYKASDFISAITSGIIQPCNATRTTLIQLQNYNRQQVENYNAK